MTDSPRKKTRPKFASRPKGITLNVYVHSTLVGTLSWFQFDEHRFQLKPWYGVDFSQAPLLSLSLKNADGSIDTNVSQRSRMRLPPFFSNLLPEGPLRDYLAEAAGVDPNREFFLIDKLRQDLPGAVILHPSEEEIDDPLTTIIDDDEGTNKKDQALHFSLAGVQLKFSALASASGGLTIPTNGVGGSYIVKLPSTRFVDVPQNEFAMMSLAQSVGIHTAQFELVSTEEIEGLPDLPEKFGQSLAVKRFDRDGDQRLHMEDFAQVFNLYPHDKYRRVSYGNIAHVFLTETGLEGLIEFIRRLTFSIMIGNADMHLKNWSILYLEPTKPSIAPAYDFVSTLYYIDQPALALSIAGEKSMHKIGLEDFKRMAGKSKLPERVVWKTVEETVAQTYDAWRRDKDSLPINSKIKEKIDSHMNQLQLLKKLET